MVYEKTASGIDEMVNSERRLTPKQRQVLIMIDGKRSQEEIEQALPRLPVTDIIAELENGHFVRNPQKPSQPAASVSVSKTIEPIVISEKTMAETKDLMIASTSQHLGLMGRAMSEQISKASSYEQLRTCISRWHMAIRESKGGHLIADELMSKVQMTLSGS